MMIRAAWYRAESAAHSRALGAPQAFRLTGDGPHVDEVLQAPPPGAEIAVALAEARYRDWLDTILMSEAAE